MSRIKSKVPLDDTSYIDFETSTFRYYENGTMKNIDLNAEERIILKYLCYKYNSKVYNYNIFEVLRGRPYDAGNDDLQFLSKKIYTLRQKVSNGTRQFIEMPKNGCYCLPLKSSPFEDDYQDDPIRQRNDGFNESDEDNIAFVRKALKNQDCQAFDIISVLAYYCANGPIKELIESRLSDDSNFVLRMILPEPANGENLEKWFIGFNQESMAIFETFESWTKRYSGRFLLHYTNLPIVDRIYINKTEKKMLVEHLSIPKSTNKALRKEYSKDTTQQIYDSFEEQFERIWNEFSYSFK